MTEATYEQCEAGQLWYPGLHLDREFPTPSPEELVTLWKDYDSSIEGIASEGVYGVFTRRDDVRAVASIDLCEVVRETALGLDEAAGLGVGRRGHYGGGWIDKNNDTNYSRSAIVSIVRTLIDNGLVQPVEHSEGIAAFLRNWRRQGVYIAANTSTLPGCEAGTIMHTLGTYYPECFDALILPRNYDGTGPLTKARALSMVAEQADIPLLEIPLVHIDDTPHHIAGFELEYSDHRHMGLFVPEHQGNSEVSERLRCPTPFDAFVRANAYLVSEGVVG